MSLTSSFKKNITKSRVTQSIHYVKELDLELEYKMVSLLLSISLFCPKIKTPVSPMRANKETPFQEV